jgi:hypothetical protein
MGRTRGLVKDIDFHLSLKDPQPHVMPLGSDLHVRIFVKVGA